MAEGSPVDGQDKIEGVGIAGHDHAVEGGGELEVAHPCLDPLASLVRNRQIGLGDRDIDLGLGQRGLLGEQFGVSLGDGRLGRLARGGARLQLVRRLEQNLGIDHAAT